MTKHPSRFGWQWRASVAAFAWVALASCGCQRSSNKQPSKPLAAQPQAAASVSQVPHEGDNVPLMTSLGSVTIPREPPGPFVPGAVQRPPTLGAPTTAIAAEKGEGKLVVRLNTAPRSLDPLLETSVIRSIIAQQVHEPLARRNPSTLELDPLVASKWSTQDMLLLSPTCPGYERRVVTVDGKPITSVTIGGTGPTTVAVKDQKGQATSASWLRANRQGDDKGAPLELAADAKGYVSLASLSPGSYQLAAGATLFGTTATDASGGVTISEDAASVAPRLPATCVQDIRKQTALIFELLPEVTWSDGEPFTAQDVAFTCSVLKNPKIDADGLREVFANIAECQALGSQRLRLIFRKPFFNNLELAVRLGGLALPRHYFAAMLKGRRFSDGGPATDKTLAADGDDFAQIYKGAEDFHRHPLGTGPYVVSEWQPGERVVLRRNPHYWRASHAGHLQTIVYRFVADAVTALQAVQAGQIDFMLGLTPEQFTKDLAGPPEWFAKNFSKAAVSIPALNYVVWNNRRSLFKDRRVRVALALLTPRRQFLEAKLQGAALLVSGDQYADGPAYDKSVLPLAYAPPAAERLLAEAGWRDLDGDGVRERNGQRLSFTYLVSSGDSLAKDLAALMQESFGKAGIQMVVRQLEWASFMDKLKARDFDALQLGYMPPVEGDPFPQWHSSGAGEQRRGGNASGFTSPIADALVTQIQASVDDKARQQLQWSLHRLLDHEQPCLFLYAPKTLAAVHNRFQGVSWFASFPGFALNDWYVPTASAPKD